jgi:serine/threonine protein kinase
MSKTKIATLLDGSTIEYIESDTPPTGTMKKTYFTPDKKNVVQFFLTQSENDKQERMNRLQAILGKFNPTVSEEKGGARGTSETAANYFTKLFCWPTGIVVKPEFGIVAPVYPNNYYFQTGIWKGSEKKGRWFQSPKLRPKLPPEECGDLMKYLRICISMSRAIRRLHQAGLAHSDLSSNNVLIDPVNGESIIIDIDSLVVPGIFPPDVMGTARYIAPEVVKTQHLPVDDMNRVNPSIQTDQFALAVIIYESLFLRHPLDGPKVNSTESAEKDNILSMGEYALFVEHPQDTRNRPPTIKVGFKSFGPHISSLIERAFVKGLHDPSLRPTAMEWEQALCKTWDMLYPCDNSSCEHKWFVLHDVSNPKCPSCGSKPNVPKEIPVLKFRKQVRPGHWIGDGQLILYSNIHFFKWHAFDHVYPGEMSDRTPLGYCSFYQGKWILVNQHLPSIQTSKGNRIYPGQGLELRDGDEITLSNDPHGRKAYIQFINV